MSKSNHNPSAIISAHKALEENFPIIGYFVWWSVNDAKVSRAELVDSFQRHNLPEEWLPKEITISHAFYRAVSEIKNSRDGKNYVVRKIKDDSDSAIFGVVEAKANVKAERLDFSKAQNRIRFVKGSNFVGLDDPELWPNGQFTKTFDDLLNFYDSKEIRSNILDIVQTRLMSISVRPKGGVYFVPKSEHVKMLSAVISEVSPGSFFDYLPIIDTEQTRDTMLKTVVNDIKKEMQTLLDEVKFYTEKDDTKSATLQNKLDAFKSVRDKIGLYESILEFSAQDLKKGIEDAETDIRSYLLKSAS